MEHHLCPFFLVALKLLYNRQATRILLQRFCGRQERSAKHHLHPYLLFARSLENHPCQGCYGVVNVLAKELFEITPGRGLGPGRIVWLERSGKPHGGLSYDVSRYVPLFWEIRQTPGGREYYVTESNTGEEATWIIPEA